MEHGEGWGRGPGKGGGGQQGHGQVWMGIMLADRLIPLLVGMSASAQLPAAPAFSATNPHCQSSRTHFSTQKHTPPTPVLLAQQGQLSPVLLHIRLCPSTCLYPTALLPNPSNPHGTRGTQSPHQPHFHPPLSLPFHTTGATTTACPAGHTPLPGRTAVGCLRRRYGGSYAPSTTFRKTPATTAWCTCAARPALFGRWVKCGEGLGSV